eukprot:XP_024998604.1 protein FAM178B isoform X2 [Gallus gallus]
MEPRSARQGPSRARRPRASPRRSAQQGSATRSPRSAVQPSSATESRTVLQRAGDVATTSSSDSEEELIPLKELLACSGRSSPAEHGEVACPQPDPLANSLDALLLEKREQCPASAAQASLTQADVDSGSPQESSDEDTQLLEEQRAFLSHFNVKLLTFPTTHPGEPIFHACPLPPPTLDTHRLQPRSVLEQNFLCASPAGQVAFVRDGYLNLLYNTTSACPLPVLRWLFQLTSIWPDRTNAFRTLWEMWMRSDDEPWCPTLQDIGQAFAYMGADLEVLRCRRLLPPELCPMDTRLDPSLSQEQGNLSAADTLALVTQLGDICKPRPRAVLPTAARPVAPPALPAGGHRGLEGAAARALPVAVPALPAPPQPACCRTAAARYHRQGEGAPQAPEPLCHGPTAGEGTVHRAVPWGAGRAAGAGAAPGAILAGQPAAPHSPRCNGPRAGELLPEPQPPLPRRHRGGRGAAAG